MSNFFDPNDIVEDTETGFFNPEDLDTSASIETPEVSKLESGALGAAEGLTLGNAAELSGLAQALIGEENLQKLPTEGLVKTGLRALGNIGSDIYQAATTTDTIKDKIKERYNKYREAQQKTQQRIDAAKEANPYTFGAAELTSGFLLPGGAIAKGATKAAQIANLAKVGAATGAAAGLGYSEEKVEDPLSLLQDVGTGAAIGGVLAPVAGSATKLIGRRTRTPVKEGESPQALKNMIKDAAELYGVGGTIASGYETAKDAINDKNITPESLIENLESGFTNPLAIGGAIVAPLAIKSGMTVKEAAADSPKIQGLYDSFLRGRAGQKTSGTEAQKGLETKFNAMVSDITEKLKTIETNIGKQKQDIAASGTKTNVKADLDAMRNKVISNKNLLDEEKDQLLNIIDNYNEGELQPKIKLVEDNKKQMKYLEQVRKNEQKIAKAQEQVEKDILTAQKKAVEAEQKAANDLKKKLEEQSVRDELLGREANLETIVPSNEDLLALRIIGKDNTPQIIKGKGAEIPEVPTQAELSKSIPLPLPEASFIKPTTVMKRTGSTPLDADQLLQFKKSITDLQQKMGKTTLTADEINQVVNKTLSPEQQKAFNLFNKNFASIQRMYERLKLPKDFSLNNPEATEVARKEAEDALRSFLYDSAESMQFKSGAASKTDSTSKQQFIDALNSLRKVDPKMADEFQTKATKLMGERNAIQRASEDINTSNPLTALTGAISGLAEKGANLAGRATKTIKQEATDVVSAVAPKTSKRLALKEEQVQQNIQRKLTENATPDALKLADDVAKINKMPEGQLKNAKLFKLMQNPMYRQLFNEEKEQMGD